MSANETKEGYVLEIRRGQGEPRFLRLPRGTDLQPTSVGARGDFRVDADGVLDVHGFVYFDGETLFVQSADIATPVRVNGRVATGQWAKVEPPATLALGDARLVFCPASQASTASAPIAARPPTARPPRPKAAEQAGMEDLPTMADVPAPADYEDVKTARVKAPDESTHSIPLPSGPSSFGVRPPEPEHFDDETTRALPLPVMVASVARPAPPSAPITPITSADATTKIDTRSPIAAPPQAAKVSEKVSPFAQIKTQWKEASLPKKAIVFLLPIAFCMVIFGLDDDAPAPAKKKAIPSASTSAVATKAPKIAPSKEPEEIEEPPPPQPTPSASAGAKSAAVSAPASTVKTPERLAVDAVAAGSLGPAADMYEELAKAHPENPAYKAAARILRAKAKK